jgi:exonuclease VII small subunit
MREPTKMHTHDAQEHFLEYVISATDDGLKAARTVVDGGPPDLAALKEYALVLEVIRDAIAQNRLNCGWLVPTEDDVQNALHVVDLVREGAPNEALIEPALRAARVQTDPQELEDLHAALVCVEDEALRVRHLEAIKRVLDKAVALFERGCSVAGFVPTPIDLANVRRLQEIAATTGAEARAERLRLAKELVDRFPPCSIVNGFVERKDVARFLYRGRDKSHGWTPEDMDAPQLLVAFFDGAKAAHAIAEGGAPNLATLVAAADALQEIQRRISNGMEPFVWVNPTQEDVQTVRYLALLVRQGAPSSALVEPARRAVRVATDRQMLNRFQRALYCLEDETCRKKHLGRIKEVLDQAVGLFERGVRVAGFVSTPLDLASVRRLREIAATDGAEALAERGRLVKELRGRLPPSPAYSTTDPELRDFSRDILHPEEEGYD